MTPRNLLRRVLEFARSELGRRTSLPRNPPLEPHGRERAYDRSATPPRADEFSGAPPQVAAASSPDAAPLGVASGLAAAAATAPAAPPADERTARAVDAPAEGQPAQAPAEPAAADVTEVHALRAEEGGPDVRGLEVAHTQDGSALTLRWAITQADVARAGARMVGQPVLCLRVVSFTKMRDDVVREVQDRPGIALEGECEIAEPPQRAIVSLGLRAGDRFVSIAHHVV